MARPLKPATPFAERMVRARGLMPRDAAAAALGVQINTLGDYERGRTFPGQEVLAKIPGVYHVSLDWLLTGDGEMCRSVAAPASEQAPVNEELLARVGEEIVELYRQENARISQRQLARLQARMYADLVAAYDDEGERLVGLKGMIQQLRRDLRTPAADGQGKRLA